MYRAVIVGCGFAGLFAAKALRRAPVEFVMVDRTNHHLFQALLYQVATGVLTGPSRSSGAAAASARSPSSGCSPAPADSSRETRSRSSQPPSSKRHVHDDGHREQARLALGALRGNQPEGEGK
jgi:glycine/D-amino acid oxidase-like deaminating enzyme